MQYRVPPPSALGVLAQTAIVRLTRDLAADPARLAQLLREAAIVGTDDPHHEPLTDEPDPQAKELATLLTGLAGGLEWIWQLAPMPRREDTGKTQLNLAL